MFGPDYTAGVHPARRSRTGSMASFSTSRTMTWRWPRFRALRSNKLRAFKRRMGWTFPWASSLGSDFNFDFNVSFTEEQQREGVIEYNYERGGHAMDATLVPEPVADNAAMAGTDVATYTRER